MRVKSFLLLAASLPAFASHHAAADGGAAMDAGADADRSNDIVVTARRREEVLEDVPLAIAAIAADEIQRRNLRRIDDLANSVPGLTFDIGGFPNDTRAALRGMSAERGRPSVAVLLDGHDLSGENLAIAGGSSALRANLIDVERIEVVRGPQSTLYGRNAFAGAINYISAKPQFEFGGALTGELGNFGLRGLVGHITGPVVPGLIAFRLHAASRETDGYYTHPVNGSPLGAERSQGFAASVRITPTSNLTIDARYQLSRDRQSDNATAFLFPNTRVPVPGGTFAAGPPGSPQFPCPANLTGQAPPVVTACTRGTLAGQINADIRNVDMSLNPLTGRAPAGMESSIDVGTAHIKWDTGSFGEFHYNFGYLRSRSDIEQDGDFHNRPAPPGFALSLQVLQVLDYRTTHYDHTAYWTYDQGPVSAILGYQRFDETATLDNATQFWLRSPTSPLAGPPFFLNRAPTPNALFPVITQRDTGYDGFFGGIGLEPIAGVKLNAEVRYNRDRIRYDLSGWRRQDVSLSNLTPVCNPALAPGATFNPASPATSPAPGTVNACPTAGEVREARWTPRFSAQVDLAERTMVYVSYAEGFKPGGFDTNEQVTLNGQDYLSEQVATWEAGLKSTLLDQRLILNAAVYRNRYRDQQIGVQLGNGTASGIINAGRVNIWGIEADVAVRLADPLTFTAAYAFTDAKFDSFVLGPPIGASAAQIAACGVRAGQAASAQQLAEAGNICGDVSGNVPGRTPKHALNLALGYSQDIGTGRLFAEVTGAYRSRRFVDEANLSFLPAYWLAGLQVGGDIGPLTIQMAIDNLFDDRKIKSAQRNIDLGFPEGGFAPGRGIVAYLPQPRTVSVRVGFKY